MLVPVFLMALAPDLPGQQSPFDPVFAEEITRIREEVTCFTDRSLYITEEVIRFSASLMGTGPAAKGPWSSVLYVELVSPGGASLARGKYPIRDGEASGELLIPAGVLSGPYFLRSYTRWMRNRGPGGYAYVPLRIINPDRSSLEKAIGRAEADAILETPSPELNSLEFEPHPGTFEAGAIVSMQLAFPGNVSHVPIRGCITVVPRSAMPAFPAAVRLLNQEAERASTAGLRASTAGFQLYFLPDKFGPSLSGSVVYPGIANGRLPETRVHITIMGDYQGYLVCRTDALGRFTIALPSRTGELELFIQPESPEDQKVEVRIDREFDQRQLTLAAGPFRLNAAERLAATIMARNAELARIYGKATPELHLEAASDSEIDSTATVFPFYGLPTRSVDLDRYVLLPTLEETFLNLVPGVTPVTRRKRNSLQIYSENPALSLFDPLIMVDQVPVFDLDQFMSVSPAKIQYIDVVEDVYVKGDMRFGGLINLRTKEGDMAGMDLPPNSFFIDYQTMQTAAASYGTTASGEDRWPDTRNTLLWIPDVKLERDLPLGLSFPAPDYPGEYVVLFRGLGPGDEVIVAETSFRIMLPAAE